MTCPHCLSDMEPTAFHSWWCPQCQCSMHEMNLEYIHYWPDGEMHYKESFMGDCMLLAQAKGRSGMLHIPESMLDN